MESAPVDWCMRKLFGKDVEYIFIQVARIVVIEKSMIEFDVLYKTAGVVKVEEGWETLHGSYAIGFVPPSSNSK